MLSPALFPSPLALVLLQAAASDASEPVQAWSSTGEVGLESRVFRGDGDPVTNDRALGMLGRLELRYQRPVFEAKVRGFGRLDGFDRERSRLIAEEAWLQARSERLQLRVGVDIVNWSATEVFHPADVINARNLDSDLENFEKIGEPMVALQIRAFEGTTFDLMLMPVFMRTRFPSPLSRLSFAPPGVDLRGRPLLLDRRGRLTDSDFGPQAALQVRQVIGSADVSVHALEHMDRLQPWVRVDPATFQVALLYQTVRQVGATWQQALGPFVAKLEGAYRWFVRPQEATTAQIGDLPERNHAALAAGLEYGLGHGNGAQSTFLLEGQAILGPPQPIRLMLDAFQRDVLVGYRFARNDEANHEIFAVAVVDLERPGEYLVSLAFQRRLGDSWTGKLGVRLFQAPAATPLESRGISLIRNGDHVRVSLTRHF